MTADRVTTKPCQCGCTRAWVQRRDSHNDVARLVCMTCGAITLTSAKEITTRSNPATGSPAGEISTKVTYL